MKLYQDDLANIYGTKKAPSKGTQARFAISEAGEFNPKLKLGENEEGTWIYSFADLIINLLMFFMMMFAISSVDPEKMKAVKQALSTSKTAQSAQVPMESSTQSSSNSEILQNAQDILKKIDQQALSKQKQDHVTFVNLQADINELKKIVGLGVALDPERDVFDVVLSNSRLFHADGSLKTEGKQIVKKLSSELQKTKTRLLINVQSHTSPVRKDGSPISTETAFKITSKHASEVMLALKSEGMSEQHNISMGAFGGLMPIVNKQSPLNERLVIRVGRAVPKSEPKIFTDEVK